MKTTLSISSIEKIQEIKQLIIQPYPSERVIIVFDDSIRGRIYQDADISGILSNRSEEEEILINNFMKDLVVSAINMYNNDPSINISSEDIEGDIFTITPDPSILDSSVGDTSIG